jgi:hypothetical protein
MTVAVGRGMGLSSNSEDVVVDVVAQGADVDRDVHPGGAGALAQAAQQAGVQGFGAPENLLAFTEDDEVEQLAW